MNPTEAKAALEQARSDVDIAMAQLARAASELDDNEHSTYHQALWVNAAVNEIAAVEAMEKEAETASSVLPSRTIKSITMEQIT